MKKIISTILIIVIAGAAWYLFFRKQSDEELIQRQLNELTEACSKNPGETAVIAASRNARIANLVASSCSVTVNELMMDGSYSPMEFAGSISRSRAMFTSLLGSVEQVEINIDTSANKAVVDYSVRVRGTVKEGESFDEARDLRSEMVLEDNKWKFSTFEIRRILER